MISDDDDETEISRSSIKAEIDIKTKNNLKRTKKQKKKPQKIIQKTDNTTKPTRCS